ncbi:MAG: nucleotide exchange factor GrpE [Lachnospiraceae bacterium]|nr:nucleotide exchange factor GrpE [Lachnospiraceae bacterium]
MEEIKREDPEIEETDAKELPDEEEIAEQPDGEEIQEAETGEKEDVYRILLEKMDELQNLFEQRLRTDEYKNRLFDQLYGDLKEYQNDVVASVTTPMLMEIISILDRMKKQSPSPDPDDYPGAYAALLRNWNNAVEDLEDLLYAQDTEPYSEEGDVPDTKRQKIVKTVATSDRSLDNQIAQHLSGGYVKNNRIIKFERVSIYKYQEEKNAEE